MLWTVAHQAPLSMGFSRQEHWSGLPFPSPGDLPGPGIDPASLTSLTLAGRFFTTSTTLEVHICVCVSIYILYIDTHILVYGSIYTRYGMYDMCLYIFLACIYVCFLVCAYTECSLVDHTSPSSQSPLLPSALHSGACSLHLIRMYGCRALTQQRHLLITLVFLAESDWPPAFQGRENLRVDPREQVLRGKPPESQGPQMTP